MSSITRSNSDLVQQKLRSRVYSFAEDSTILKVTKNRQNTSQNEGICNKINTSSIQEFSSKQGVFRTTYFKSDQERKIQRIHRKSLDKKLPPIGTTSRNFDKPLLRQQSSVNAQNSGAEKSATVAASEDSNHDEIIWEDILHQSTSQTKDQESIYDNTTPSDSDVINHIVRLREALHWKTMLPRHGPGVRQAMKLTNHKNPLDEMLDLGEDTGEFVYAVLRPQKASLINPFDLQVVSANHARNQPSYYIITATSITKCTKKNDDVDSEVHPVIWWLYEQRLFNMICKLPVFVKFRVWKQFNVWRNAVRGSKTSASRSCIASSLFVVDVHLQGCLLYVRRMCEDVCGSRDGLGIGKLAICFLKYDSRRTYNLEDFRNDQESNLRHCIERLKEFRDYLVRLAIDTCTTCAEDEGITTTVRQGKVTCKQFPTNKQSSVIDTTFAQLASWRKALFRLFSFLHLLDYLVEEMLNRLILISTRFMLSSFMISNYDGKAQPANEDDYNKHSDIARLYNDVTMCSERMGYEHLKETTNKKKIKPDQFEFQVVQKSETADNAKMYSPPIFTVRLVLNMPDIETASCASAATMQDKALSRRRVSAVRFSSKPPSIMSQESVEADADFEDGSEAPSRRQSVISEQSIKEFSSKAIISPTKSEIISTVQSILEGFRTVPLEIDLICSAEELKDFTQPPAFDIQMSASIDEEEEPVRVYSNKILTQTKDYSEMVEELVGGVGDAVDVAEDYVTDYNRFCLMVDESRQIDVNGALMQQEWAPEEFAAILYKHTEMTQEMRDMKSSKRIALFHVDAKDFAKSTLPYPQAIVDATHKWLPVLATRHNEELLSVIRSATQRLDSNPDTVEQFVDHLTFLARTSTEMPALDNEFLVVTRFFKIIKDYGVWLDPEQLAIFHTLVPAFQHLKTTLLFCEAKKDENILRFSGDLDKDIYQLRYQLFDIKNKVAAPKLLSADSLSVSVLEIIKLLSDEVEELVVKARSYANYQDRFGSSYTSKKKVYTVEALIAESSGSKVSGAQLQAELAEVERDITLRKLLWESTDEWTKLHQEWTNKEFLRLNIDTLQETVSRFMQTVFMLEKGLPRNDLVPRLKQSVLDFKRSMPLIAALRNTCLQPRHWEDIQYAIGRSLTRDVTLTLGDLLKWRLFQHRDLIMEISTRATNEHTLQAMLNRLIELWHGTDFKLVAHSGGVQTVMIISTAEEILNQLEESQVTIATIKGSRYVTPIKGPVEDWERRLMLFSRSLDEWMKCQRNWLYLEPVFTTIDIQRQLPTEAQLFAQVDQTWRDIMRTTEDHPNALRAATGAGVLESLQTCNSNLEKIQKSLENYLEMKRLAFPRFYFLSNDELLSVLSHGRDPQTIQPHLVKCFANIKYLDIRQTASRQPIVHAMISAEGEVVDLPKNVKARGSVEQWLSSVESAMYDVIRKRLKMALLTWTLIPENLILWMMQHPGQVVLTVAQIMFNKEVTNAFHTGNSSEQLQSIHLHFKQSLHVLSEVVSHQQVAAHQYLTLEALIIIYVHMRDIIQELIQSNVTSPQDFTWNRQLLYEWQDSSNMCRVVQADARFTYGCEYIGCGSRLVITPLTDRCFLTLTGALNLHLGGSPAGPAGTGKSETVKDLAKILGKQCVVFNCSEGIDFKMTGQFFSGLSQSGSWCCFDEFNRIDVEVLSVIASQVHAIKSAKDAQTLKFMFEGREVRLNTSCAYFITMNPGYLGRVELPDNLKSLFRPVAMMVPDYALITEIILFSEGFREAKAFSRKVVNLYELASKQLSQQDHYDFGMRSIKSVLVMAGQKKREVISQHSSMSDEMISEQERSILIHSLKNANLPRFLAEDAPLFHSIMSDLFPGISPPSIDNVLLEKCIEQAVTEMELEKWPDQVQKVVQLHEQLAVRHGVMLVGPSGGGKTTVRSLLQRALSSMYASLSYPSSDERVAVRGKKFIDTFSINPKCVTLGELYGYTDPNTLEWADGLLAYIVRKFAKELANSNFSTGAFPKAKPLVSFQESQGSCDTPMSTTSMVSTKTSRSDDEDLQWRWIILDGPVDTAWVENLNTALDDTKTLCLANGERVNLPNNLRIMFEVDTLAKASPATISRCAMVYMDPVDLGWRPYVKAWIDKLPKGLPKSGRHHLSAMFDLSIDAGLQLLDKKVKLQQLPVSHLCVVQTLCRILRSLINFMEKNGGFGEEARNDDELPHKTSSTRSLTKDQSTSLVSLKGRGSKESEGKWFMETHPGKLCMLLGRLFVFAFTWSVGGVLSREDDQEDDTLISSSVMGRDETLINMSYDFDQFVHDIFEKDTAVSVAFPSGSRSIFSYFVDLQTGRFTAWDDLVPSARTLIERGLTYTLVGGNKAMLSNPRKSAAMDNMATLVPTTDTIRYSFLSSLLLLNKHPVLLSGDSGVGKTALLQNILERLNEAGGTGTEPGTILGDIFHTAEKTSSILQNIVSLGILNELDENKDDNAKEDGMISAKTPHPGLVGKEKPSDLIVNTIQFSALTQPSQCQNQFLSKLVKRSRGSLGPPRGKKCIVFVNDLNMPSSDEYGAQPPLELIRQFLDLSGFYDVKHLTWRAVVDVMIAATAAPSGGGGNLINERTLKHFSVFAIAQPSTKSLQHIYQVQLGHFLENRDFMPDVKECCHQVVNAGIAIYYRMCNNMLPTPNKSHYTFNLRDLSAVIRGIFQADESVIVSRDTIAQLFAHEVTRIFHDRLTDAEDRRTYHQILSDELHNYFKITIPPETFINNPTLFGDFSDLNAPSSTRTYRQLPSHEVLCNMLEEFYMRISSSTSDSAHLVFFDAAINHVIRASRVFRQAGTHLLLVGIDGTGKATTCKLAAQIAGCRLYRLSIVRGYSLADFREELKRVLKTCGVENLPTVFLLTDADLISETFLEDINCLLNTGEGTELFDQEELDGIVMDVKRAAVAHDVADSRADVLQFFRRRVTRNLHIAIATSPAGGTFRRRCRTHPALVNCCTVDWFEKWPEEALTSVAYAYLSRGNLGGVEDEEEARDRMEIEDVEKVSSLCVRIHFSAAEAGERLWKEMRRRYYTTPSTYLEFVQLFTRMLGKNKLNFHNDLRRLNTGLNKLAEAKELVGVMQRELIELGPKIENKAEDTERLMAQLIKDTKAVDEVRVIVKQEEATMLDETQLVQDFAQQATIDLQSVLPALQEAVMSLDALDKSDIAELRVYKKPPQLVLTVMSAVCILLQAKADWSTAKQLLADPSFLKNLVLIDRDAIPARSFAKLKRLTKNPDFTVEQVAKVSVACKSMCMWVLALQHYDDVKRMVEPKQRRVKEAQEALEVAQENLRMKQASLAKIEDHLTRLKLKHEESVKEREALKERRVVTGQRLQRAAVLISALSDEEGRWKDSVLTLKKKLGGLVGDTIVSAASVAYLGPFIRSYRHELTTDWLKACHEGGVTASQNYDMVKLMADSNQIRTWHNQNLPRDAHSTENAVIIEAARRWALIIDPQGQAINWIKEMEKDHLRIVHASDHNYMKSVENAIRVGETLLLCDVRETLDPELRPVLQRDIIRRSGQDYITIGGTEMSYNSNFRLFMTTSRANHHFLPAVCIAVTVVNFIITFEGLQGQLLSSVVTHERPQLEAQRGDLLRNIAQDMRLLQELEDKALLLLENQEGHILDDEDLIITLKQSKLTSDEVMMRLKLSEENEMRTEAARGRYLPVATRGAVLYFVLADLEVLNSMYQFSLQWFTKMFIQCVEQAHVEDDVPSSPHDVDAEDDQLDEMLQKMIDILTQGVYKVVSYSLFAQHQLVFSFLLATAIMRNNARHQDHWRGLGALSDQHWSVFLHTRALTSMSDDDVPNQSSPQLASEHPPHSSDWINSDSWRQCRYVSARFPAFKHLCQSIVEQPQAWEEFAVHPDPFHMTQLTFVVEEEEEEEETEPSFDLLKLSSFERLILIKILRSECLLPSVRSFVHDLMGELFIQTDSFNLGEIYAISQPTVPLIFILSPGTDPSAQLLRYAKETRGSVLHVDMVSLGRGQGPKAEDLIHKAQILKGRWVFLQNCHLAASFMPRLQAIVEDLKKPDSEIDPEFRLWLSSKPDPSFPLPILQNGLKIAVEPPRGIRAHLQLAFGSAGFGEVTQDIFDEGSSHKSWKPLLFALCCFNALAHERRKFGTLGFNLSYDFTSSDLEVSILMLKQLLATDDAIPWSALQHLTGEVAYGGRVTDGWDRRCLVSMLRKFYCDVTLLPGHTFSRDGAYKTPAEEWTFTQVREYINNLPLADPPDVFGMHDNAERAFMESESERLIDVIIQVQPKLATASVLESGRTDVDIVTEITNDVMARLPCAVEFDGSLSEAERDEQLTLSRLCSSDVWKTLLNKVESKDTDSLQLPLMRSALLTVARQEIDRFNKLLNTIHSDLRMLSRAIGGEIVMTESLEQIFQALLLQKVPESWQKASYESCKLFGSWLDDLIQRVAFFAHWAKLVVTIVQAKIGITRAHDSSDSLKQTESVIPLQEQPASFWLSAFFFPQGFLTAVLQNYARKHTVPVDALSFQFVVQQFSSDLDIDGRLKVEETAFRSVDTPLDDGVRVFGLYLDSARWEEENGKLVDSHPNIRYCEMPEILFIPTQSQESPNGDDTPSYECPLYRTSVRAGALSSTGHSTNFVTSVNLPTDLPSDHWILRGAALLCQLDH